MIEEELSQYLRSLGASLVGFGDLSKVDISSRNNMNYGISIAVRLNPEIIQDIGEGPTKEYYEEYRRINEILDEITIACVKYINNSGYNAIGQTSTYVTSNDNLSTPLPHKTVATRAGLGWIGKNALLITPQYGSAIRLSSVITDMPLKTNNAINKSKCGTCNKCEIACPGTAIKGKSWNVNSSRDELLNPLKCRKKARELLKERIGLELSICGKCIEVCPVTQLYIKKSDNNN